MQVRKALVVAAVLVLAVPAAAQWTSDKPPVLQPEDYPPEMPEDAKTPPPAPEAPPPEAAPPPSDMPESNSGPLALPAPVEVDTLGRAEGLPAGTLDDASGGLGEHLWSGSARSKAEDLLKRAPLASADPLFRDLTRRVILTKAGAPAGGAKRAFIGLRIEKLLDGGLVADAGALAAQASVPGDDDFARLQAGALLLANRSQDVCGEATATRQTSGELFWMQLRAFCAALSGDTATAELTEAVMAAQGLNDKAYKILSDDVLQHQSLPPGVIAHPSEMHVYLLQQAGLPIPEALAKSMGTAVNLLVMRDPRQTPRARFEAAERVAATGAASAADLKQVANAQDLPLSRVANAGADAPALPFFMGQVLLHRAAAIETRPEEKERLLLEALDLGSKAGLAPLGAALQADVLATLKPAPGNPQARAFARALLLAGRPDAAARWTGNDAVMRVIAAYAAQDPAKTVAVQRDVAAFAADLAKPEADADRSTKVLLLGLADELGWPLPENVKAQAAILSTQAWDGVHPGPGSLRTLQEIAANPQRRGEAILLLLDTVRSIGLADLAPEATIEMVRLLQTMNQAEAARALALEALAQFVPPPLPPPPAPAAAP
jgi:hypothetical protein